MDEPITPEQPKAKYHIKPRWKPGESGNPAGRPRKEVSITSLLKDELDKIPELIDSHGRKNTLTWNQLLVQAWLRGAVKGQPLLLKELVDRIDGKVKDTIEISGNISERHITFTPADLAEALKILQAQGITSALPEGNKPVDGTAPEIGISKDKVVD